MRDFRRIFSKPAKPKEETDTTTATAAAIIAAAARRDAGGLPVVDPTGIAAQIIAAGKKRRGEK
jgi:hypothetical protein